VILLLAAAVALQKTEAPLVQILGKDLPAKEVFLDLASPDGNELLAHVGPYCRSYHPALDSNTWPIVSIHGSEASVLVSSKSATMDFVAISNSGTILGNGYGRRAGGWLNVEPFLYEGGEIRWPLAGRDTRDWDGLEATGFSSDGGILIRALSLARSRGAIMVLHGPEVRTVLLLDNWVGHRAVAETPLGYFGELLLMQRDPALKSRGRPFAAMFDTEGVRFLPVPQGATSSTVTAVSPDGEFAAGYAMRPGYVPLIWANGKIAASLNNVGTVGETEFTGFARGGALAVGRIGLNKPRTAIVWRPKENVQSLADFLKEKKAQIPESWTLIDAKGVNADGTVIVGSARNKEGDVRPFRIQL
jgi:hypothetical protein